LKAKLLLLVLAATALVAVPAAADTIVVDTGGSGDHTAINPAISAASSGDTILVMPGTYTGLDNKNWDFEGRSLVIRSTDGAATTIIDCEGSNGITSTSPGEMGPASVIEGLTLTRGNQYVGGLVYLWDTSPAFIDCIFSDSNSYYGGALYVHDATPSFTGCIFTGNASEHGGAAQIELASPTFSHCEFNSNTSSGEAGGVDVIWDASPSFTDCIFYDNSAVTNGGGLRCYDNSSPALTRCDFIENTASLRGGGAFCDSTSAPEISYCEFWTNTGTVGGGLACEGNSSPAVSSTAFIANDGGNGGGGVYADFSSPTFYNCTFLINTGQYGGGAYCYESASSFNTCVFWSNTATSTRTTGGGGLYCDHADVDLDYVSFSDNGSEDYAGGINCYMSDPDIANCIIAFSTSGPAITCENGTENPTLSCCDIYGNAGGDWVGCIAGQLGVAGNISADPLFCDRPGGILTIDAASPCAPDNSGGCGTIGSLFVDCDSPVQAKSWGEIKAMYR
jgi:hypothetical protein